MRNSILTIFAATIAVVLAVAQTSEVPYPEGYRDWRHVKSMVISEGHPLYDAFGGFITSTPTSSQSRATPRGFFPTGR
jgi:hypothetical protein